MMQNVIAPVANMNPAWITAEVAGAPPLGDPKCDLTTW